MNLELVRWVDSRGTTSRWCLVDDLEDNGPCSMISVGWVCRETKSDVQVAPHIGVESDGEHQVTGVMTIPKECIIGREVLHTETEVGEPS
ncbi:MAG: hypothetical protein AAFX52_10995 [Pseudomonadota bacterium]